MRAFKFLILLLLLSVVPAQAQQAPATKQAVGELMTYYYKDPRVERLVGYIEQYDSVLSNWNAYPPAAGFYAFVFRTNPNEINRLISGNVNPKSASTLAAALRLAGNPPISAASKEKLVQAGLDEKLRSEYAGLPARLEDIRIRTGTHLDILWGASFASGDPRFARMIAEFFAQTANRSEPIALDVTKTTIAMMGGPKDIIKELKGKHGNDLAYEIIIAATALWGLQSNAKQHAFVERAVVQYLKDHAGTNAAKALAAVRPKPKSRNI